MAVWEIRRLDAQHDRSRFDCGHPSLNEWLRERAGQFDRKGLARTFAASRHDDQLVLGYYSLSTHRVVYSSLPEHEAKSLPQIDVPVALLGRLAVDRAIQRQGLGSYLLIDAFRRIEQVARQIGIRAIEVDAIDASARAFYLKYGFQPLLDDPFHMFLSMKIVQQLQLPPL